jgi:Ig-like domain CHU_C associated
MKKIYTFLALLCITFTSVAQLPVLPLDFESATINYTFTDFDGGATVKIANPQSSGINTTANVARMVKSAGNVWGGSWISLAAPIDFSVNKTFKVKVYSPRVGAKLLLKVENATNPAINFEKETATTIANAWEDLTFDYSTINTANQYQKLVFIFDNGTMGDGTANFTFLFDDVRLIASGGGGGLTQMNPPVTFDDVTVNYGVVGFGGAEQSTIVTDPTLATNKVAKVIKTNTAELWAGTTVTAVNGTGFQTGFSSNLPFTASATKMNVRVWSPHAGIQVRLKVEDKNDATRSCETEAAVTIASGWQTLEFNFANQAAGTAALNLAFAYNKVSIFFNFGVTGATAGERIYYFDDVKFGAAAIALTQMNPPVTFDDVTVNYGVVGFGGAEQSTIVTDPTLATNKVAKVIKTNTAELWAGTTVTAVNGTGFQTGFSSNLPFTASATKMNVRVWSPHAGIQVRLKVEDKNDATRSCETEAAVTIASGWQTLEFNFANQAAGTAALNLAFAYNKVSIFFNFGVTGATAGERIYYFDDVKFGAAATALTQMNPPVTFDDVTVNYGLVGFGGAEQSTIVTDPTLATNKVAKVIKTNTAELWAGTTVTAVNGTGFQTGFSSNLPFTASATKMNVRVWSPHAGIQVRLKVEDKNDATRSCETEAAVTIASGWQTLEFNFANQAAGTAALNLAFAYNKVSIFFNFGVTGATAGERIYYFDDVKFGAISGGGGTLPVLPLDFESATINYTFTDFDGGATTKIANPQISGINTSANVARMIKSTGQPWGGSWIQLAAPMDFSVNKIFKVKVYSPRVGAKLLLKVENELNPAIFYEKEATTTVANAWEELTFDYGTINTANQYHKLIFIFDNGTMGNGTANFTFLFDDVRLTTSGGPVLTLPVLPLEFETATVNYTFTDFDGGVTTKIANPQINGINTSANVARMVKNAGQPWGGSWIQLAAPINFTTNKIFKVKVFSPRIGAKLLLKVENDINPALFYELEAVTTVANTWEELTYDFSAINTANQYHKLIFIFDNGTMGNGTANFTFLFDDVRLIAASGPVLTQMNLPVTFDDVTVNYGLIGFGGAEQSTIVTDPTLATNKVAKVIKSNTAELWAGTTLSALLGTFQSSFSSNIPFTATATKMNVRVWSPHAGIQVRLKVEDKNDPTKSCETEATVTIASGWQTLEFNFANQAPGTAALNVSYNLNKASIFFNFGVTGATAGERIYYFDDLKFGAAPVGLTQMNLPVNFEGTTINYGLVGFGGAEQSTIVTDPTLATNKVAKVIKVNTAELWAGTTVTAVNGTGFQTGFSSNIPFTACASKMNVRVWSPHAGIQVRLKVEDKNDPTKSCETEATVTTANGWQNLEFNFLNQAAGTAALNLAYNFNKVSIFFNFGVTGATAGERIYYFDDVTFGTVTPVPAPTITTPVNYCQNATPAALTATAAAGNSLKWYTVATGGTASNTPPTPVTTTPGTVNYYVSQTTAAGCESPRVLIAVVVNPTPALPSVTPVTYCQNVTAGALTATATSGSTLKWYTTATGGTGTTTAPVPATSAAGSTSYYVSQTTTAGCEGPRAALIVTINAAPATPAINTPVAYCLNATAQILTATATSAHTLNWYNAAVGGSASVNAPTPVTTTTGNTTYYVSQTNGLGCESQRAGITVTINALPAVPVINAAPYTKLYPGLNTSISISGGAGNTFAWYRNGLLLPAQTANAVNVNIDGLGNYQLKVTNTAGCSSSSNIVSISGSGNEKIFIYPNPSSGTFQVRYYSDISNLQPRSVVVYNAVGDKVYSARFVMFGSYTAMPVNLENKAAGIYTVYLLDNEGNKLATEQVVIY